MLAEFAPTVVFKVWTAVTVLPKVVPLVVTVDSKVSKAEAVISTPVAGSLTVDSKALILLAEAVTPDTSWLTNNSTVSKAPAVACYSCSRIVNFSF